MEVMTEIAHGAGLEKMRNNMNQGSGSAQNGTTEIPSKGQAKSKD